jgi:hypothetical protein
MSAYFCSRYACKRTHQIKHSKADRATGALALVASAFSRVVLEIVVRELMAKDRSSDSDKRGEACSSAVLPKNRQEKDPAPTAHFTCCICVC